MSIGARARRPRLLGAHVSVAGGLPQAVERAVRLGCTCMQIFAANPRSWRPRTFTEPEGREFRGLCLQQGIRNVVLHAIYLVNLTSADAGLRARSVEAVRRDLRAAGLLGAKAVVVHAGFEALPGQGEPRLRRSLAELLDDIPKGCRLLLENSASRPETLGSFTRLTPVILEFPPMIGLCLDTAHACGAGFDLGTPEGLRRLRTDLRPILRAKRLGCIHLNDSKMPCGSYRDRHENLGKGHIGLAGLKNLVQYPGFRSIPFILETPGFDQQGPDQKNMNILRTLAAKKNSMQD